MATATRYEKDGQGPLTITYAATGAVAIDEILLCGTNGNISVGVAREVATAAGNITVDIGGCYVFPKSTGAAIKAGETVDWDTSAGKIDDNQATLVTGDVADFGVALADAAAGTSTVPVQLRIGANAVT